MLYNNTQTTKELEVAVANMRFVEEAEVLADINRRIERVGYNLNDMLDYEKEALFEGIKAGFIDLHDFSYNNPDIEEVVFMIEPAEDPLEGFIENPIACENELIDMGSIEALVEDLPEDVAEFLIEEANAYDAWLESEQRVGTSYEILDNNYYNYREGR